MKKKILLLIIAISVILGGALKLYSKSFYEKEAKFESDLSVGEDFVIEEDVVNEPEVENQPIITNVSLLAVGDIMFHSPQFIAAKTSTNSYNFNSVFKHVEGYIKEADIALGNFETVTAGKSRGFSGFPRFNSPKEVLGALKDTGFDILSTANNHCLDQGKKGLISTIEAIEEYGIKNIGTYKESGRPILIEEIQGIKIGVLSYTYALNGLESLLSNNELNYMVNRIDEKLIEEDIKQTKEKGADIIIVFIHWGHEYHREPSIQQIKLSKQMVEWGANIILGSHPHVIQRSEIIEHEGRDNLVIYSMGNFLSNQRNETMGNPFTEDGVMVKLILEKDSSKEDVIIKDIIYIPTWVYRYRENNKLNYEILPLEDIDSLQMPLSNVILTRLEKSYNDTLNKINDTKYLE